MLDTRDLDDAFIRGKETIELNYPESSKLHLIAWGNLKGHQDVNEATKAEDFAVSLKSEGEIAQSPDSIFFGDIDVTVRGNGVAGGNQEIVLEPKTGTVEMRTLNLQYALTAKGLRATDECDFYMDRTLNTIDYKGRVDRRQRLLQPPKPDWKDFRWETTGPQALYLGQNMTGSIQVGNDRYEVKEGTFDDGTTGPIEIHPFQRTLVLFA